MDKQKHILPNGLRVVLVPIEKAPSTTVLVFVSAGSKHESREEGGLAHFLEHMCFKGTPRRPRPIDISYELDAIGSQSNAFTSRDFTGYYAKAHPKHFLTILDVVSDLYLNPLLDPTEMQKEKGVILEEINMYEDLPHRLVQDVFMEALYGDTPIGRWEAGTRENVAGFTRDHLLAFRQKHYTAAHTTVFVSGSFDPQQALAEIATRFSTVPEGVYIPPYSFTEQITAPSLLVRNKDVEQTHIVLGVRTSHLVPADTATLKVLNSVLGGGMSSRLFERIREKMGVGYYIHSSFDEYKGHSHLAASVGVDKARVQEVVTAIISEMSRLATELVADTELQKAKEYVIGNTYLALESSDAIAEYYAVTDFLKGELVDPKELADEIQAVTAADIQRVAREIMRDDKLAAAFVGPVQNEEDIKTILHF